ncbi:MAG: DUF2000 domain-containing protein [Candidatus Diapherotrites archaeon]|uniref:DUF2000 domain-containing protein n=1 Tax=Candidatus Iainarchaeum sp. TaxID=3101447 RepID=A0A938YWE1_9ARCH|nr:DUF2000 domain-containing protein [Candidatus Diapherotrites archaeon]
MLGEKTVAVLDENLSSGIAFNTLAHLALSIGKNAVDVMGKEELTDASGTTHKGLSKYPFIILKAESEKIRQIVNEAKGNAGLLVVDFPEQGYTEYTDEELQAAIAKTKEENIKYYGTAIFGPTKEIDELTKELALWK